MSKKEFFKNTIKTFNQTSLPRYGYLLPKWGQVGYRATAHAYMKREALTSVQHTNGKHYTLNEIENGMIN